MAQVDMTGVVSWYSRSRQGGSSDVSQDGRDRPDWDFDSQMQ
jgi:hypothetical protein